MRKKSFLKEDEKRYKATPGRLAKHHLKKPCKCGHRSTGYGDMDFDEKMIHRGAAIEFEHTCNNELAKKIAEDHIAEMGYGYYPELNKMEKKLLKQNKGKEYMEDNRMKQKAKKCKSKKKK